VSKEVEMAWWFGRAYLKMFPLFSSYRCVILHFLSPSLDF
jgi:hypothetical protein